MPSFKLDDREIPFEKGDTIIKAAWRLGVEIPHYCWHPGLSVAANCRMCLVEIEPPPGGRAMMLDILAWDPAKNDYVPARKPKLQPSCQVQATDGMVVRSTTSAAAVEARAHVQEFLLVNHPVDCPICDQAGECKLQDYWMTEQRTFKRMRDEPVHKPKAVPFGDTIVYDAERCIACTRCIRVCDEVVGDHMLDLRERGNKNEIVLAQGRKLEGDYTLMTEHVCPVGALTSSHFRFKARVWTLKETASVCPGCATGCTMWLDVDPREARAYRNRPRDNPAVNGYWMCDDGMMTYEREHEGRILRARVGRESREEVALEAAVGRAAEQIKKAPKGKVAVLLGAQFSTEDNLVVAELARALDASLYLTAKAPWRDDKILRHADQNPNRAGARAVAGLGKVGSVQDLLQAVAAGQVQAIVGLGADADVEGTALAPFSRVGDVVLLLSHEGPLARFATVTLPATSWVESPGSFVNAKGIAQAYLRALAPKGDARPAWELAAMLGRALGHELSYRKFKDVRAALLARAPAAHPDHKPEAATPVAEDAAKAPAGA